MTMLSYDVDCPNCKMKIHVPFLRDLEAKAGEDFDLAEISAQERLSNLWIWLHDISLFGLIIWLLRGRKL